MLICQHLIVYPILLDDGWKFVIHGWLYILLNYFLILKEATATHHLYGFDRQGIWFLVHNYVYSLVGLFDGLSIIYFDLVLLIDCLFGSLFNG